MGYKIIRSSFSEKAGEDLIQRGDGAKYILPEGSGKLCHAPGTPCIAGFQNRQIKITAERGNDCPTNIPIGNCKKKAQVWGHV